LSRTYLPSATLKEEGRGLEYRRTSISGTKKKHR
jgi:hypothetical protein